MSYPPQPGPPAGYTPPPGYAPPPGAPQYGAAPPPRRRSGWTWVLWGCGGCAVLSIVLFIVFGAWISTYVGSVAKGVGPITPASVKQDLGADVPLYPNATLNPTTTQIALVSLRTLEKASGKQMYRGGAMLDTPDDAAKIMSWYDEQLKANGWQPQEGSSGTAYPQKMWKKGNEIVAVQVQPGKNGNQLMILRGGPGMPTAPPGAAPGSR